jgi:hypothetical protein
MSRFSTVRRAGRFYADDINFASSKMVQYIDVDGDLVTIKITKGVLFQGNQSILGFEQSGSVGGRILKSLDFTGNPSIYSGTSLFVTAEPQPGFIESGGVSDGKADVGLSRGRSSIQAGFSSPAVWTSRTL